jgi:uncharacterized damage-inducible protein DinB
MTGAFIRPAFATWAFYNDHIREAVADLTTEQLALRPFPDGWPIWAILGHALCQRVFWLCDFAGESGVETTRFTDAAYNCPGDDDLDTVLSAADLVDALDATWRIVEHCLDTWTVASLGETLSRPDWDDSWVHTRGSVIQRVFGHDVYHVAEVNVALGAAGLPLIDLWD